MFVVKNQEIYQTCGNTGGFTIASLCNCQFPDGYSAIFKAKKDLNDIEPVLIKSVHSGRVIFQEDDTQSLAPGLYWYVIEIRVPDKNGGITQVATIGPHRYHLYDSGNRKGGEAHE